jgi:hypothetical protein
MSTHPNTILMAVLTVNTMTRATYRAILAEMKAKVLHRARKCGTKRIIISESEAKAHAKHLHKIFKCKFKEYSCPFCNGFHVGRVRSHESGLRRSEKRFGDFTRHELETVAEYKA